MSKIIVINGISTSGKSTFVTLCHEINPKVIETSTVDFVKKVALYAGWNGKKDELGRKLLNNLKKSLEEYNDIPNTKIDDFITKNSENIIFINVREPYNIEYYKRKYDAITLLIQNLRISTSKKNLADKNVFKYNYDFTVFNNGTLLDLKKKATYFLKNIGCYN